MILAVATGHLSITGFSRRTHPQHRSYMPCAVKYTVWQQLADVHVEL